MLRIFIVVLAAVIVSAAPASARHTKNYQCGQAVVQLYETKNWREKETEKEMILTYTVTIDLKDLNIRGFKVTEDLDVFLTPIIRGSWRLAMRAHCISRVDGGGCSGTLATRWN